MDRASGAFSDEGTLGRIEARAIDYAREAGRMAMASYRTPLHVTYKSKRMRNPVTGVDKEIESFLRAAIARDFPGHGILGEEGTGAGAEGSDFLWVLDPLDGTTNFINSLPFFAVSIGVLHRLAPVAAAIFSPETHLGSEGVFHAARGGGAYLDDLALQIVDDEGPSPRRLASVPGSYGGRFKIGKELRRRHGEPRVMGSVALEMALTAAGVFQFAVFGSPKIWDVAAGVLIVREAGGTVLARNRESGAWEDLEAFTPIEVNQTEQAEALRKWARSIVAGSPRIASFVAQHLTVRTKSRARGRSDSSQAAGKPDSR